jgi:membrane protease YdiL (CAAX protease family)
MQHMQTIAWLALGGALTVGLCRLLRLKPVYPMIAKPKRSALCSIASVSASMLILFALVLLSYKHGSTQGMDHKQQYDLASQLFLLLVYFLPMALIIRLNGETLQSVGFTRANLCKATVVGLFLAATTFFLAPGGPGAAFKFTQSHNAHSLIFYSFVGFGEEFLFRGYLQSRLVAWLGHYQGWILASVIMALVHLPPQVLSGVSFPSALASSLGVIPASLLMGFVMLRTGNAIAPSIYHTFANWVWIR